MRSKASGGASEENGADDRESRSSHRRSSGCSRSSRRVAATVACRPDGSTSPKPTTNPARSSAVRVAVAPLYVWTVAPSRHEGPERGERSDAPEGRVGARRERVPVHDVGGPGRLGEQRRRQLAERRAPRGATLPPPGRVRAGRGRPGGSLRRSRTPRRAPEPARAESARRVRSKLTMCSLLPPAARASERAQAAAALEPAPSPTSRSTSGSDSRCVEALREPRWSR